MMLVRTPRHLLIDLTKDETHAEHAAVPGVVNQTWNSRIAVRSTILRFRSNWKSTRITEQIDSCRQGCCRVGCSAWACNKSPNVEAEPRAAASRVGIGGPSPVVQRLLAGSGFQTLLAPPSIGNKLLPSSKKGGHRLREENGLACIHQ